MSVPENGDADLEKQSSGNDESDNTWKRRRSMWSFNQIISVRNDIRQEWVGFVLQ